MSTLLYRNRRLLALAIALVIVAGLGAFQAIPRLEDPVITNRFAQVITRYPGANAARVEALVTEKLEQRIRELSEVKNIMSSSRNGVSFINIELRDSVTAVDEVWSRIRDKLNDARRDLPADAGEPQFDDDRTYAFTMITALEWTASGAPNYGILKRYAEELQNRLRNSPGTAFVRVYGTPAEEIRISIDPDRLASLGLSASDISRAIAAADSKISAGQLRNRDRDILIEITGALQSLDRIRRIPVRQNADGSILRIGDLASVHRTVRAPPRDLAFRGRNAAAFVAIRMEFDRRVDQWSAGVRQQLERFRADLPQGLALKIVFDQSTYTSARLLDLATNLAIGAGLVVLVLLVTLGWRSALIAAATLPLTSLIALACLNAFGIPIHQMSVTGLIVALGLLVDNAIVMTDQIRSRRQAGVAPLQAIDQSVRMLWVPLLASTLTTILAFMPVMLLPGPTGEFVGAIGFSVVIALVTSYLLSLSVIPALAGIFMKFGGRPYWWRTGLSVGPFRRLFSGSLRLSLRYPKTSMIAASLVPLLGFAAAGGLTEQFFPPADRDQFHVEFFLPQNTSIHKTKSMVARAHEMLKAEQGIREVNWTIGTSFPSFYYNLMMNKDGMPHYAQAQVKAASINQANRLIPKLQALFDRRLPEARVLVRKLEQGPPFDAPLELRIYGSDPETLRRLGDRIRALMARVPSVTHTSTTLIAGEPKLWFRIDEDKARLAGLTPTEIARQLEASLEGVTGGTIVEGTEVLPVRVRVGDRSNLDKILARTIVPSGTAPGSDRGQFPGVPLSALGAFKLSPVISVLPRRNGERLTVVQGFLRAGVLPKAALDELRSLLDAEKIAIPAGYRLEFGGEAEKRNESVGKLAAYLAPILVLMIAVVVLSFNSFRYGGVIFVVALQSMGLGLLSLAIMDYPLGFVVMIGLMGLIGLAINAAIIITASLREDAQARLGDEDRIRDIVVGNCSRHIISTTITTMGGFLPLILADGGFWPPFAVAIAGGTLFSTVISFYFVPAIFLVLTRREVARGRRKVARVLLAQEKSPAGAAA